MTPGETGCTATREYVATLQFLRDHSELQLPDAERQKIADQVATGCSGAGLRFIRVAQLLFRSGLGSSDALKTAIELSHKTDREAATFITVFEEAFLSENLDLDLRSSMQMARALSTEFQGDVLAVRDDFRTLVDYCAGAAKLDLPKPECGRFAVRLAKEGEPFSGGIARPFIETFEFLRGGKDGPGLATHAALKMSEQVLANGPAAGENFVQAYRYATAKAGLGLGTRDALQFAESMAKKTTLAQSLEKK
jgi:hypothetical protein